MPTGKHVSKEMRAEVLRLLAQGLTHKVISIRTGLHPSTIYNISKQRVKEEQNGTLSLLQMANE